MDTRPKQASLSRHHGKIVAQHAIKHAKPHPGSITHQGEGWGQHISKQVTEDSPGIQPALCTRPASMSPGLSPDVVMEEWFCYASSSIREQSAIVRFRSQHTQSDIPWPAIGMTSGKVTSTMTLLDWSAALDWPPAPPAGADAACRYCWTLLASQSSGPCWPKMLSTSADLCVSEP